MIVAVRKSIILSIDGVFDLIILNNGWDYTICMCQAWHTP